MTLMAASCPSNREAAETKRNGCVAAAPASTSSCAAGRPWGVALIRRSSNPRKMTGSARNLLAGRILSYHCAPRRVFRSDFRTSMTRRPARLSRPSAHGADSASAWRAGRKRLRDHSVKRDAVVRVAAKAFSEHGFHNTSLDDIAKALEVTKPTIYYYVTNKEQLLFECFVAGLQPILSALRDQKTSSAPARERLNAVLRQYAQAVASDFGWCLVRAEHQDLSAPMSSQ